MPDSLLAESPLALIDHHVHGAVAGPLDGPGVELLLTEAVLPAPPGTTAWDTPLGFAIRRWCAPVLDLEPSAPAADYLERRAALGAAEVNRRFLAQSQVAAWLVDTGYQSDEVMTPAELEAASGTPAREVVRLEALAERVARGGVDAAGFADAFEAALTAATIGAVGLKSIAAYRYGLDFDPAPPEAGEVAAAAGRLLAALEADPTARIEDPVLIRQVIWAGVRTGLPLQFHVGMGDPDARLHRVDPGLMHEFLLATQHSGTAIMLLHCYPYHRQAAVLSNIFPHVYMDVGEALNHVGARSAAILAEALEVVPFHKLLYSSDAFGLAELHYLGATGFRRDLGKIIGGWVADGLWSGADGSRVAELIGSGNSRRVYRLDVAGL
ncbi:MAG TPA: amidohydrolase family protein [Streptosporangiaceae bacterium]|nr:amidohydrolase family protein [Streptosporangiaceae bacterium]